MVSRRAFLMLGVAVVVTGCAFRPPRPQTRDVEGVWAGPDGALITLRPDSTAEVTGLSGDIGPMPGFGPISGQGTWQVRAAKAGTALATVEVDLSKPNRMGLQLFVDRDHRGWELVQWIGDPDDGERYTLRPAR